MKNFLILVAFTFSMMACLSPKTVQKKISTGQYDQAIDKVIGKVASNKNHPKNETYILLLEEAYAKAQQRDLKNISYLKTQNRDYKEIYALYKKVVYRQNKLKPLLPLELVSNGRYANFEMKDYSSDLIAAENGYTNFLYQNANNLLLTNRKESAREAYDTLLKLRSINSNYPNISGLIEEAKYKGTDFILLAMENKTEQIIPRKLEEDLLNIDTYGLNNQWRVYHNVALAEVNYDVELKLLFKKINLSPEQIIEKQLVKEKQVKDGWKYLEQEGKMVKDSLGNYIKVDKFRNARCEIFQFTQRKTAQVIGDVEVTDLKSHQLVEKFPIESSFLFEHSYATYSGEKDALDKSYLDMIVLRAVTFPSNEQMIYDTGSDLKLKLKAIITNSTN